MSEAAMSRLLKKNKIMKKKRENFCIIFGAIIFPSGTITVVYPNGVAIRVKTMKVAIFFRILIF